MKNGVTAVTPFFVVKSASNFPKSDVASLLKILLAYCPALLTVL